MAKIIKSPHGNCYIDVSDKAVALYETSALSLYQVYMDGDTVQMVAPIWTSEELYDALDKNVLICIEIDRVQPEENTCVEMTSWEKADKIQHDGYVYVRSADLKFCNQ